MAGERHLRLIRALFDAPVPPGEAPPLCKVSAMVTGMSGAGIMLMGDDAPRGSACTTNEVSASIEDLQFALGEGPCVDAFHDREPVLEPDLAAPRVHRWPAFAGPALDAGVAAIFGFPIGVGAVGLGALNLYRAAPGPLTDQQHADALVMADISAQTLLMLQVDAPPDQLASELEAGSDFQSVVHQASGMVAVQLGISVGNAMLRLRAHAFADGRPLSQIAGEVVDRTLRFANPDP